MATKCTYNMIVALTLTFLVSAQALSGEELSSPVLKNSPERSEEFMDWGLGMFVHWGVDSQLGSVISHSMVGASQNYLDRYLQELPKSFNPDRFDPETWMQIAKLAGVKYMVFTAKHHSGFCMWDTKTTDFSIMNTPYKKDIVKQFVDACRKYEIKVGLYFSPEDFHFLHRQGHLIRRKADYANISQNRELLDYDKAQIAELLTQYGPIDVLFLDAFDTELIRQAVHTHQPKCIVTRGEMETPEQNIPDQPLPGPWESCFTLGSQWQYKPTNEDYKSGTRLIEMLIEVRAKGGNLLINMGPDPKGVMPFEQQRRFRELALWMFVNGEAVHGIRPCSVVREGELWFTQKEDSDTTYVFLTQQNDWKRGDRREFKITSLQATEKTKISVLGQNSQVVEYMPEVDPTCRVSQQVSQLGDALTFSVVRAQRLYNDHRWPNPIVVKLEHAQHRKTDHSDK